MSLKFIDFNNYLLCKVKLKAQSFWPVRALQEMV